MSARTVGVVQARIGSTRLPGKMIMKIGSYSVAERVHINLQKTSTLHELLFAIPNSGSENEFADFLFEKGIPFFRGSLDNLANRHLAAASSVAADVIVRIPGDNPFVDADEVDRAVNFHLHENRQGFTTNLSPFGNSEYPDGIGAEVFDVETLEKFTTGKEGYLLEHPHLNFLDYSSGKQIEEAVRVLSPNCPSGKRCKELRLDINNLEDLTFLQKVVACHGEFPLTEDIVKWYNSLKQI